MINQLIENLAHADSAYPFGTLINGSVRNILRANAVETEKAYELSIEVPGIAREQISIELENGVLTVAASYKEEHSNKDDKDTTKEVVLLNERVRGEFKRRFTLPKNISRDAVKAKLKNGVLVLTIAKPDPNKVRAEVAIAIN